jgi:hypothetical protein
MDSLFLPREVNSIENGPQTFAGTDFLNTTFYFVVAPELPELPGLLNDVLVSNAGYNNLNGIFNYVFEFENKPYYNKNGDPNLFIVWFDNKWEIYDFNENNLDPIYFSNQDVLYPWDVSIWNSINSIYNPIPTFTKVL